MTTYLRHLCGLGFLLAATSAQAANVPISLWAKSGTTDLPGAPGTPVLGYVQDSAAPVTAPGGPVLRVNVGDVVTITLTNGLNESTAILFQGQGMVPDTVGAPAPGGTKIYTFTASNPGTFLYEAALLPNSERQAAMGLAGALVVQPVVPVGAPAQAYGPATTFDSDAVLVLSEIDTSLNASPATFDMRDFKPQYFLINGKPYTSTSPVQTLPGPKVLLRFVNAGQQNHSMTVLGMQQSLVGKDGSAIAYPSNRAAETIAPGETLDAIATVPGTTVPGTKFAVFDGNLSLYNSNLSGYGGMLTFLQAGTPGSGGGDVIGPATTGVTLTPSAVDANGGSVTLAASVSDAASGNSNVAGAEYFVDTVGAPGAGAPMGGSFGSPVVTVNATIPAAAVALLATGNHNVYVRGRDSANNWGAVASAILAVDKSGPTTSGLGLTPASTNGTAIVALNGTADDQASGGANILAAEYFIDATGANGAGSAMAVAPAGTATVASLTASIAAATVNALAEGSHTIQVHAQDTKQNWGAFASKALVVDRTGPTSASLAATPGATNGTKGLSSSQPVVRITGTAADGLAGGVNSSIAGAEGFLDAVGANGSGFVFLPTDGSWNGTTENAFGDIPLTALALLREENHPVYVHARDAAGNWGATSSVNVLVDRTPPLLTGATLTFNPAAGYVGTPVVMTVNGASDPPPASPGNGPPSGVAGGEYWLGTTAPAPGGGTAFTGPSASIPTTSLAAGTYTVGVRVRDAAGNWSASSISGTFSVALNNIFADGFESGTTNAWTSRSTGSATRLNVTAAAAMAGSFGLQAQGNNTNYVQYNFGTTANPAASTFDARFYFRPSGNTSTGKDVFSAATSSTFGTTLFRVRYRLSGSTPQVQIQLGATTNTSWTNIPGGTSNNVIEVVYQAVGSGGPSPGSLRLYVNGVLAQTLTVTSTGSVGAFRLGSVTSTGNSQVMYFDQFASKRLTTPLWGP
jgi:hypothetical protein